MKKLIILISVALFATFCYSQYDDRETHIFLEDGSYYDLCGYDYDTERTEAEYKKALVNKPQHFPANEYGYFLIKNERYKEAIAVMGDNLYYIPWTNNELWNNIGKTYFLLEDNLKAKEYYMKAYKFAPKNPYISYNLCEYYHYLGKKEKARKFAKKVKKLSYEGVLPKLLIHMNRLHDISELVSVYGFE